MQDFFIDKHRCSIIFPRIFFVIAKYCDIISKFCCELTGFNFVIFFLYFIKLIYAFQVCNWVF